MNDVSPPPVVMLKNAQLTCEVALRGAALQSLRDAATDDEFIWQRDPRFWAASAPILFPVIGRLKDGGYRLDGRFYEIPKHGFARDMDFSLMASKQDSATFRLGDNETTAAVYPYSFMLEVAFTLRARTLAVDYRVVNLNEGEMIFALGSHPAFNLPTHAGVLQDWSIEFDVREEPICHRVSENLLSSAPEPFEFSSDNSIVLSDDIFMRDALIFKALRSRQLRIIHREHGVRVQFDTGGSPTLGIWAKPGAPFVCLEPWCGFDDSSEINTDIRCKPGMLHLSAGEIFATRYSITI